MKHEEEKRDKILKDILKELEDLKKKIHSDFIKIDIALLEEKIKKLTK
ncbi:MAG: hypothetical protein J6T10_28205 [Methanobrevibacter sp.]|nr:hypothetical protein [Methanobrevibacter sp.]